LRQEIEAFGGGRWTSGYGAQNLQDRRVTDPRRFFCGIADPPAADAVIRDLRRRRTVPTTARQIGDRGA
jgi:hypothetical protein